MKITLQQEHSKGWGVKLVEGKDSLIEGGTGIFVGEVDKEKPAGRLVLHWYAEYIASVLSEMDHY